MSVLKKHWRFTVPAVVVLCTLLIGVVVLYSTGEPPEPKTVYVMPERSTGLPSILYSTTTLTTSDVPLAPATNTDVQGVDPCCPDEAVDATLLAGETNNQDVDYFTDFDGGKEHDEWQKTFANRQAESNAYTDEGLELVRQVMSSLGSLIVVLSPEERGALRGEIDSEITRLTADMEEGAADEVRKIMAPFWEAASQHTSEPLDEALQQTMSDLTALHTKLDSWEQRGLVLSD